MLRYLLFLLLLCPLLAQSQTTRMPCNNDPPPEQYVQTVAPLCDGLDGFQEYCLIMEDPSDCGAGGTGDPFPGCVGNFALHSPNWFAFVAGGTEAGLNIEVSNCNNTAAPVGIQFAVYELNGDLGSPSCDVSSLPLDVVNALPSSPNNLPQCNCIDPGSYDFTFETDPGSTYYMVFDGCADDLCEIRIRVESGGGAPTVEEPSDIVYPPAGFEPPVGGDMDTVCIAAQQYPVTSPLLFGAASYIWTLPDGTIEETFDPEYLFDVPPGAIPGDTYEFCVIGASDCDSSDIEYCETLVVAALDTVFAPPIFLCEGETSAWIGGTVGPYTGLTADLTDNLAVMASDPALFDCSYIAAVTVHVQNENDEAPNMIDTVICGEPPLTILGTVINGPTQDMLISQMSGASNGCDTFYSLTADFLYADLSFDPNDVICIGGDITVPISNSQYLPPLGSPGLVVTYEWTRASDGMVVGAATESLQISLNDFTQDVEVFELTVTMTINGMPTPPCDYGVFTVELDLNNLLPEEGMLDGPSMVCVGQPATYIFTTTDTDSPDPGWTNTLNNPLILNQDFTNYTLQFTESGIGQVCITPTNLCGSTDSTCITVTVVDAPDPGVDDFSCDDTYNLAAASPTGFWFVVDSPSTTANAVFSDIDDPGSSVTVSETGTWQFGWALDPDFCFGTVSIVFLDSITLDGPETYLCDNLNVNYTLSFTVQGGLPPYSVVTGNGTMMGANFESDPILSNDGFTVVIQDAAGCQSEFVFNPHECSCETEGGAMDTTLLSSCGEACHQAIAIVTDTMMDGNDVAEFILHDQPGASITNILARNTTGEFCFIPTVTSFDVIYYISLVIGDDLGGGAVDLDEGCTRVAPGQRVIWNSQPVAMAADNISTCRDSVGLLATPSVGVGTWAMISGPGTATFSAINSPGSRVSVTACGSYEFSWTEDNNGCIDSDTITTNFLCNPEVASILTPCNGTQTAINLTINLQSGTPPYMETTGRGTIMGNAFSIPDLPLNTPDTFYFEDDNGCTLVVPVDIGDCSCITESGEMALALVSDCQDQTLNFTHDMTNIVQDANDSVRYFVHTRADDTLGVVIASSVNPSFSFADGAFICDSTYYVSAVAGNWGGTNIDLADPCLNVSVGQPMVFDCPVMVDAGMDVTSCDLDVDLTGTSSSGAGVWTAVTAGASIVTVDNLTGRATLPGPGQYTFEFSAANGQCTGDDEMVVTVPDAPVIDPLSITYNCNNDNDMYTVTFTVSGGDQSTYTFVGTTIGAQTGNSFTSDLIPSGTAYSFEVFDVNDCRRDMIADTYTCPCVSTAGNLTGGAENLCENEDFDAAGIYDMGSEMGDGNDVRNYILSDNQTNPESSILIANTNGTFSFDDVILNHGTTYYVAVILGDGTSPTTVDPNDPCLSVSGTIAVTWYNRIDNFSIDPSGLEITCQDPEATLSVLTSEDLTGYDINWTTIDGNIVAGTENAVNARVTSSGTYVVTISHPLAGCDESQMVSITQAADLPTVVVTEPIQLTCTRNEVAISGLGSSQGPEFTYEWSGPGIVGSNTGIDITADVEGVYVLTVRNTASGCENTGNATLTVDRNLPAAVAAANERLDCDTDRVTVSGLGSMEGGNVTYSWAVIGTGNILSGANERDMIADAPGTYELTVVNLDNGCTNTAQATVIQEANIITGFETVVQPSGCAGVNDGVITISNILGGVPPYSYSYDGGATFTTNASQGSFSPGIYPIVVRDDNNCEVRDTATLPAPFDFFVDLGEDQMVELGNEVVLNGTTNLPDSLRNSIAWSPLFDTANQNSLTQTFTPAAGQYMIVLAITNSNGCTEEDVVNVFVRFEERVFVPTAIHTNGLATDNRYLNIYANPASVAAIKSFRVFNRWGDKLYERTDVPVQLTLNTLYAWDGTFKGEEVDPGVYTYVVEVEYVTGISEVLSGGVTLLK